MRRSLRGVGAAAAAVLVVAGSVGTTAQAAPKDRSYTRKISVSASGGALTDGGSGAHVSANGRFAAFSSTSAEVVAGDTNGTSDAFVRDLRTGTVERVSVGTAGAQADGNTYAVGIGRDGRHVLMVSDSRDLVPGHVPPGAGDPPRRDLYLHDRRTGVTRPATVREDRAVTAVGAAVLSSNGRYAVFTTKELGKRDAYVYAHVVDLATGASEQIARSSGTMYSTLGLGGVSDDGRYVAYSKDTTRAPLSSLYVHDRVTGEHELVTVNPDGTPAPWRVAGASLAADGRTIAFTYYGDDLIACNLDVMDRVIVKDLDTGATRCADHGPAGTVRQSHPVLSPDGRHLAFEAYVDQPTSGFGPNHLYLQDLRSGTARLVVSVDPEAADRPTLSLDSVGRAGKLLGYTRGTDGVLGPRDAFVWHAK